MGPSLADAELRVMDVVWDAGGEASASSICGTLEREDGLSRSAIYTLIYRCIRKGALERSDPGFLCRALVSRDQIQDEQMVQLADRLFDGSLDGLFAALVGRGKVSPEAIERARDALDGYGTRFGNRA